MARPPGWCDDPLVPTLLIVDDHDGFRHQARALLAAEGFEVVGEAPDGAMALAAVERLRPDVVLLDILLPDIDGFEVARRLAQGDARPRIVLTSSRYAADFGDRLPASAAAGFVHKGNLSGATLARIAGLSE
jgi:DNA-binding NarL/FixJ family response regulator